ncbi:MAG: hydroxyacid dehydrogenase [Clostridia bacterium]|nr:hydroxyacid dehydrogenase [Clostridia bacterium]
MNIVILDADSIGRDLDYTPFSAFGHLSVYDRTSPAELHDRIADAGILLLNKVRVTEEDLAHAPALRLICLAATGFDNVDVEACRRRGVAVCNVVGYSTDAVAQLTVAMALSLICRLPDYTAYVRSGAYTASGVPNRLSPAYHEVSSLVWGILGYGKIGQKVGQIAQALGCKLLVCKKTPAPNVQNVDIDTLCRESDVLSVHLPLSAETRGIVSEARIASMKPGALLINVARGAVLDEAAAARALSEGRIGGLASDVYGQEPMPADHPYYPLRDDPRAIFTPHMACGAVETRRRLLIEIQKNISAFLRDERRCRVD